MRCSYCAVDGCTSKVGKGLSFFRCPKNEARCQKWKKALGFTGDHRYARISAEISHQRIRICSLHFSNEHFMNPAKKNLTISAIPSLNLPMGQTFSDANVMTESVDNHDVSVQTFLQLSENASENASDNEELECTEAEILYIKSEEPLEDSEEDTMEPPAEICENYQLKWSSYSTYIHSCIASSLVTEDSFADVALVTMDGHKIMAHRFVLSYASQYLNKALRFHPKVTTALPIMIVLPQSITYKALKILVKYMYSGEATVTKDILNVVLKAGDILKIKGLYREEEDQSKSLKSSKSGSQISTPEPQVQKTKDLTKVAENQSLSKNPPPLVPSSSLNQKIIQSQSEASKAKESQKTQQTKIMQSKIQNRLQDKQVPSSSSIKQYGGPRVLNFTMTNFNGNIEKENASPKKNIILNQKVAQSDKPHTITSAEADAQNSSDSTTMTIKTENGKSDNLSYLVIKDEPLEWTEAEMEIVDEKEVYPEDTVKTESYDSTSNEGAEVSISNLPSVFNIGIDKLPPCINLNVSDQQSFSDFEPINIPALILKNTNPKQSLPDKSDKTQIDLEVFDKESISQNEGPVLENETVYVVDSSDDDAEVQHLSENENFQTGEQSTPNLFSGYDSDKESFQVMQEFKEFDPISFFEKNMMGRAILQKAYQKTLGNSDRDRLADLAVAHFTNKFGYLSIKQLKILSKRFELIPNENSKTYFVDPVGKDKSVKGKSEPARGKLVDKNKNRSHLIRTTLGMVRSKRNVSNTESLDENTSRDSFDGTKNLHESDFETSMVSPNKKLKIAESQQKFTPNLIPFDKFKAGMDLKNFDLVGLITHDLLGQALFKKARQNTLTNSDRDRLADLIIPFFLNKFEGHLETSQIKTIAKLIELHIPFEKSTTYFIGPVNKGKSKKGKSEPARGKLTDKYKNLRQLIKTIAGQVKKIRSKSSDRLNEFPNEAIESKNWLLSNTEPESEVFKHWNESMIIRRSVDSDVSTVFQEWPILKTTMASALISIDFNTICKIGDDFNLEYQLDAVFNRVCNSRLFTLNGVDKEIFNSLQGDLSTDSKIAIQLYFLPTFVPARGRLSLGGVQWKPSVLESRSGLMVHLNNTNKIPKTIKERIEYKANQGLPANPYIIVVGEDFTSIVEAFVIVHEHVYKFASVIEALCFCFKLYLTLRLKYPYECRHIWYLIQWEIFRCRTESDEHIAFMNDLLT